MRFASVICLLTMASELAASGSWAKDRSDRAKDVYVVGTIENISYQHEEIPDDMLGHGWFTARLHISRTVSGKAPSSVITVRYFAHTYMGWKDFLFHLRPSKEGDYIVCSDNGEGARCD
jgi:integration host factor subunit beta